MGRALNRRRWLLAITGATVVFTGVGAFADAVGSPRPAAPGRVAVMSEPGVAGAHPSVSDDGRWIVYEGAPTDGTDRTRTVWLRDAAAFAAPEVELTVPATGATIGDSVRPSISGDGCVVAFVTEMAYDLFRDDDTGDRWDVYRMQLPQCEGDLTDYELVSTRSSAAGDTSALDRVSPLAAPAVSQAGSVIAFTHQARAGKDPMSAVTVVDLTEPLGDPRRSMLVGGTPLLEPNTTFRYVGQRQADLSDNGRFVAFTSDARSADPVPEWGDGPVAGGYAVSQVFVWDREAAEIDDAVVEVSAVGGAAAAVGAQSPAISGNGQFVAFESPSPDLAGDAEVPECGVVCHPQVYRADIADGSLVLVSREPTAPDATQVAADQGATQPTITTDGTQVGFVTRSRNLFVTVSAAGASPTDGDIVVSEVDRGIVRRASTLPDRVTPAPGGNANPMLSASGHVIVFDSVAGDAINGFADDVAGRKVVAVSRAAQLAVPSLDVGTVAVLLPSPEWFVPVRNDGPSTFVPGLVESDNPEFVITGGTCQLGVPVPPGGSCNVEVVLTPVAPGARSGELTVTESMFGGTSVTSPLIGAGGDPALEPTFSGLDYPATAVGRTSVSLSTDVANIGFGPTQIAAAVVTGDHPDDFVITANGCASGPVNPGATCSIDIAFAPTEAGLRTATVNVFTELGQYTSVLVNGAGTRTAVLETATDEVRAGDDIGLGGSGFRPGAEVIISWADGRGGSISMRAGGDGTFLVAFPTQAIETSGVRTLVAQSGDQVAKADIEVLRNPRVGRRPGGD